MRLSAEIGYSDSNSVCKGICTEVAMLDELHEDA